MSSELYYDITPKERSYQDKVIKYFNTLGYTFLGDRMYGKNQKCMSDGSTNDNILEDKVEYYLRKQGYTDMQIPVAISKLKDMKSLSEARILKLVDVNCKLYEEIFIYGVKAQPSPEEPEQNVYFFDFNNPKNNDFYLVEEVSYIDSLTGKGARPDLVVYVNGIALAVIELKRCIVDYAEAIRQTLSNENGIIPSFFTTVQYTVASSEDLGFEYGTINTPEKFWCAWKHDTSEQKGKLSEKEAYLEFFRKDIFLKLVRYGVVNDGGCKKVMRPHQLHALNKCIPRLEKKESGIIWHSQGSGKSLTMVWIAAYIKANFQDPRVIVVTDRDELDKQIHSGFTATGENIARASSAENLLEVLSSGSDWLVCSLVHKFGRHIDRETGDEIVGDDNVKIRLDKYLDELRQIVRKKFPMGFKVSGENVFVFVDECHRTQGGKLHEAMKEILGKEVMLIGFTGTPLLKSDKNKYSDFEKTSVFKFGAFIHQYLHKEAVEDKVVLDLQYEARNIEQHITNKQNLDANKTNITNGLSKEQIELVEKRWATLESVYSTRKRILSICYSILDDYQFNMLKYDWCNAMLIAGDIPSAYAYYELLTTDSAFDIIKDKVAVVTSYRPSTNDIRKQQQNQGLTTAQYKYQMAMKSYQDHGFSDGDKYEEWAKSTFKKYPARLKLLIVVDKLLTGFDAPSATYLYIDRGLKDYTLFQALCRVNRLGVDVEDINGNVIKTNKQYGLIVDFKHLFGEIKGTITKFNTEGSAFEDYDDEKIDGLLTDFIKSGKSRLEDAEMQIDDKITEWNEAGLWIEGDAEATREKLLDYYMQTHDDIDPKEARAVLYKILGQYILSYSALSDHITDPRTGYSKADADKYEEKARVMSHIRQYIQVASGDAWDVRVLDPQMKELLNRFVGAGDAYAIINATSEFSFLDLIDENTNAKDSAKQLIGKAGSQKGASDVITGKARSVINSYKEKDPQLYAKFSERLQAIIDRIRKNTDQFVELITKTIELIIELKSGGGKYPQGIRNDFEKAMYNNRSEWAPDSLEDITTVILDIEQFLDDEVGANWKDQNSSDSAMIIKKLKRKFKNVLNDEQVFNIYKYAVRNLNF